MYVCTHRGPPLCRGSVWSKLNIKVEQKWPRTDQRPWGGPPVERESIQTPARRDPPNVKASILPLQNGQFWCGKGTARVATRKSSAFRFHRWGGGGGA